MKMPKLFTTWTGTRNANHWMAMSIGGLVISNLILVGKLAGMHERLVMEPPNMTASYSVGWNTASADFYQAWGLYVASSVGSVTPQTAHFVADHLAFIIDAKIYPAVRDQIYAIADDPAYTSTGSINVFEPHTTLYEPSTNRVFVSGTLNTTAYRTSASPIAQLAVTYEMVMVMRAGLPKISAFTSYLGEAHTLQWKRTHPDAAQSAPSNKLHPNILPQPSDIRHALETGQGRVDPAANGIAAPVSNNPGSPGVPTPTAPMTEPAQTPRQVSPARSATNGVAPLSSTMPSGPTPAVPTDTPGRL